MASIQCQRPVYHTHAPPHAQNHYQKPVGQTKSNPQHAPAQNKCNNSCSCCQGKENEHSFTIKVKVMANSAKGMANSAKEMANSAYKKVADQMHHHDQPPNAAQKQAACHGSGGRAEGRKKEGTMTNCIPKIGDLKKKEKHSKNKGNNCKCKKDGNSSSSDSESDNDAHVKHI